MNPENTEDAFEDASGAEVEEMGVFDAPPGPLRYSVPSEAEGERLDIWLARAMPSFSRSFWTRWIRQERVRVDGVCPKPSMLLAAGADVELDAPPLSRPVALKPEPLPLDILYEDAWLMALNKAPGMVVHPAAGQSSGTLAHALAARMDRKEWDETDLRPGIVHRLDKDTSGVMVVACTRASQVALKRQFKARTTRKHYLAVAWGSPDLLAGTIAAPIGRNPHHRKKMMVDAPRCRAAVTHYERVEDLHGFCVLRLRIETGRTHQIRVHLASIGCPVLGDAVYGGVRKGAGMPPGIPRQMLHAEQLELEHPQDGRSLSFQAPMPEDMRSVIRQLRETAHAT